jgi:flagellar biosynthesis protein FlhG
MVRRVVKRGAAAPRSALGPRGRGLFERLFGGSQPAPLIAPRAAARTLAIASGKGGTGKSFLATSLALAAHARGKRVTLVDCDFGLACDHLLLGVTPRVSLHQLLCGKADLREVRVQTPYGPHLVPGGSGVRKMADLSEQQLLLLGKVLSELASQEELLLLDIGAGISPQTMLTMLCADHILLVTQPEIAALTDAYAVIKCLVQLREATSFSVVVNRVLATGQGRQTFAKLQEVAARFTGVTLHYLGEISEEPRISQRRLRQEPLVASDPEGATAQAIAAILDGLEEVAGPLTARPIAADQSLEERFRQHRLFL